MFSEECRKPLQLLLMYGAVRLSRKSRINAASTQMFVQSSFQEELVRGVIKQARSGGWERNFLVCNTAILPSVDVESKEAKNLIDIWGKAITSQEDKQLYTMTNELLVSVPYENKIKLKVLVSKNYPNYNSIIVIGF